MKRIYQIPVIEVNEVFPTMLLAGSDEGGGGDTPTPTVNSIDAQGENINILFGGGGNGKEGGGGAPRSNGSMLWDD